MRDDRSRGGVAQCDVRAYYDSLDLVAILADCERNGLPSSTAAACVAVQLLPRLRGAVGPSQFVLRDRTAGSLTGSRVAGAAGRWPVERTVRKVHAMHRTRGFKTGDANESVQLTFATYVDNIYALGRSLFDATQLIDHLADELYRDWSLRIKEGSRECMAPRGSAEAGFTRTGWRVVPILTVLGRRLADDGAWRTSWDLARRQCLQAWFAVSAGPARAHLQPMSRLRLVERVVGPIFAFHCSAWPVTPGLLAESGRLQRQLVAMALRLRRAPLEDPAVFVRRRGRTVAALVPPTKAWPTLHCRRLLDWEAHLQRHPETWAGRLLGFHGRQWLRERRAEHGLSLLAGRTGTRVAAGHVHMRWHDSLELAARTIREAERDIRPRRPRL